MFLKLFSLFLVLTMAAAKKKSDNKPVYLTESEITDFLDWASVNEVIEQALMSVTNEADAPVSSQPGRAVVSTTNNTGVLLSMPGYLGNYDIPSANSEEKFSTLSCKLVTSFRNNQKRDPPIPNILGTIFIFDTKTGKLSCILEATTLTAWRTASASLVATKHLYFGRNLNKTDAVLTIVGCGTQGEAHAIGMLHTFPFSKIKLWNRTKPRAEKLAATLNEVKKEMEKSDVEIEVVEKLDDALMDADVIVTATYSSEPLVHLKNLKKDVHINAIGAGEVHHSEIAQDVYDISKVYIDYWAGARTELANLKSEIVCEVGEVILKRKIIPQPGVTVFQSIGMAVEDAAIGQLIFEKYKSVTRNAH